jgi:hypothetical protein
MDILLQATLVVFSDMIYWERSGNPQLVLDVGQLIKAKTEDMQVKGQKVSDWVDFGIASMNLCAGKAIATTEFGIALPKKYIFCDTPNFVPITHDSSELNARNANEAWFIIEEQTIDSPDLQCTVNYQGITYAYSYRGQYKDIWTIKNIHTLQVVSKKTYVSKAPVCGFMSCSLNQTSKTASCIGGEGGMAGYADELEQWIKNVVR